MAWGAAILALLQSLPQILSLATSLVSFVKKLLKDDPKKFLNESAQAAKKLRKAKSRDEKIAAARDLQRLIGKL